MHEWTNDLVELVADWMRIHDISADEDAIEELRDDINDTLEWMTMMKISAMMGGRI